METVHDSKSLCMGVHSGDFFMLCFSSEHAERAAHVCSCVFHVGSHDADLNPSNAAGGILFGAGEQHLGHKPQSEKKHPCTAAVSTS